MDLGLKGKTAIITGGSGGIGQGMVLAFAREGINVLSASRDVESGRKLTRQAEEAGYEGKVLAVATDVSDRSSGVAWRCSGARAKPKSSTFARTSRVAPT